MRIFNDNVVAFYCYSHLSCNAQQSFVPQSRLGVIFVETARRKETKGFFGGGVGWSVSLSVRQTSLYETLSDGLTVCVLW